ncbi:MAG: CaiB/BaiF CoA transferase family protein [Gammaproteobacteria bacterium]
MPMLLEGIRVLDFTQYVAGSGVTRLMAELGAEIVKVEIAPVGDPARLIPFIRDGRSGYFVQQNRGKQSLCVDFGKPETLELLRALVPKCDVVVENFGPGVLEKRGLDYPGLRKLRPDIIMCSVSAYGRDSLLSHKTGYDWIIQAFAGFMHMTGPKDGPPHPIGLALLDVNASVHGFGAVAVALFHRQRTGEGQYIDLSMVDCAFHMHDLNVHGPSVTHGEFTPHRMGTHHEVIFPFGVFKGPTGYLCIAALQLQWKNVCECIGRPDLVADPRYDDGLKRAQRRDELVPLIEAWLATCGTNEAALAALDRHRVPATAVLSPADARHHPYFRARGTLRTVPDPVLGEIDIPGFPFRFSAQPTLPDIQAPLLGEHNAAILKRVLAYSDADVAGLAAKGVLVG